jgi:CheY-like chemotaxis protein
MGDSERPTSGGAAPPGEQPRPANAAVGAVEMGGGERVLYVDDESMLVFLVSRHLERLGYRVTGIANPLEAEETFRARPADFDAVVMDLSMPGLSGFDLATRCRAVRPDIPIVFMSGYVRPEDIAAAKALNVRELVGKANTIEELGTALHRALQRRDDLRI